MKDYSQAKNAFNGSMSEKVCCFMYYLKMCISSENVTKSGKNGNVPYSTMILRGKSGRPPTYNYYNSSNN